MNAADDASDIGSLAESAQRLGLSPRQLLIAAARLAEAGRAGDVAYRERVIDDAREQSPAAESAAHLLLTPIADYAINDVDRLFASIWPDADVHRDA